MKQYLRTHLQLYCCARLIAFNLLDELERWSWACVATLGYTGLAVGVAEIAVVCVHAGVVWLSFVQGCAVAGHNCLRTTCDRSSQSCDR